MQVLSRFGTCRSASPTAAGSRDHRRRRRRDQRLRATRARCARANCSPSLQGSRHDGHDFIAEAVARGCAAVLIERPATSCGAGVPPALCSRDGCTTSYLPEVSVPVCMVPNVSRSPRPAVSGPGRQPQPPLETDRRDRNQRQDDHKLPDCGRAQGGGPSRRPAGNTGIPRRPDRSVRLDAAPRRRAERAGRAAARMVGQRCSHAVMEVSSHASTNLARGGVDRFDAACVTNVSRDHLGLSRDHAQDYRARQSRRLFKYLCAEGFAVLNADDLGCRQLLVASGWPRRSASATTPRSWPRPSSSSPASRHSCSRRGAKRCRCGRA